MNLTNEPDFNRRFPAGVGENIVRNRCKDPETGCMFNIYTGGPVDLIDPNHIMRTLPPMLGLTQHLQPCSPLDIFTHATTNPLKGIIYPHDHTYKQFTTLTLSRKYITGGGPNGTSPLQLCIKVPFLIWFGSEFSFLSESVVKYFFAEEEADKTYLPVDADGVGFLFLGPGEVSRFGHYCILGQDFLRKRFKVIEADFEKLEMVLWRRGGGKAGVTGDGEVGALTPEWVRDRDDELEDYIRDDDDDDDDDDEDEDKDMDGEVMTEDEAANHQAVDIAKKEQEDDWVFSIVQGDPEGNEDDSVRVPRVIKKRRGKISQIMDHDDDDPEIRRAAARELERPSAKLFRSDEQPMDSPKFKKNFQECVDPSTPDRKTKGRSNNADQNTPSPPSPGHDLANSTDFEMIGLPASPIMIGKEGKRERFVSKKNGIKVVGRTRR